MLAGAHTGRASSSATPGLVARASSKTTGLYYGTPSAQRGQHARPAPRARGGAGPARRGAKLRPDTAPDFEELVRVPRVLQLDAARERHTRTQLASLLQEEALVRH